MILSNAVDTPDALLNPHGVPGHIIVDQDAAGLQVEALAGGFGADQDFYFALFESSFYIFLGRERPADAIPNLAAATGVTGNLAAIDDDQLIPQVIQSIRVLGENQQLVAKSQNLVNLPFQEFHL